MRLAAALVLVAVASSPLRAQTPATPPAPIQDNSFLLEEAYNQEEGVVQTIQTFQRTQGTGDYVFTLTQEWPVPDQRHQLSFTLPLQRAGGATGVGDLALNYRYQLAGDGDARIAFAPRLTLLVPTGNEARGLGTGSWGGQVGLPLSVVLGPGFVAHTNLGATYLPDTRDDSGRRSKTAVYTAGQSLVWLAHPNVNVFVEALYTRTESRADAGAASYRDDVVVSPALRAAINVGRLQIVPGIAFPFGVGPSRGSRGLLLYLSFEHPLWGSVHPSE